MKLLLILYFTLFIHLSANTELKSNYVIQDNFVMLSDIIKNSDSNLKLFDINTNKRSLRIKTKDLLKTLNKLGYKDISSKHNYTQFTQKSLINTDKLELYLRKNYKQNYLAIEIVRLSILPRSYLQQMPQDYTIFIHKNAHLSNKGILEIKTNDNKKIFFQLPNKSKTTCHCSQRCDAKR